MKILMVTPYPPIRDGIASYAVQEVVALREAGHDVEVLSPWPSAAHHHLALQGWRGPLALAKHVHRYDKTIIQFHPDIFYPLVPSESDRIVVTTGLIVAFVRARLVEVRVHELNFDWGREQNFFGRLFRFLWSLPDVVTVHTAHERLLLSESTGRPEARVDVMDHGHNFVQRVDVDRSEARRRLGLDDAQFVFLAIGFIQPHKGFDRAVRAFDGLGEHGCELHVVGSVRVEEREYVEYAALLRNTIDATGGASLHEGYVSDESFDLWLVAADSLLLPYRFIWSSGVLERAALYGTQVIATRVGGLESQRGGNVRLVEDDRELAQAMRDAAGVVAKPRVSAQPWPVRDGDEPDREAILAAIRQRAAEVEPVSLSALTDGHTLSAAPFQDMPLLGVPEPHSPNPFTRAVKKLVRRLTAWEIDPIVHQLNAVHAAAAETETRMQRDETG